MLTFFDIKTNYFAAGGAFFVSLGCSLLPLVAEIVNLVVA